MKFKDDGRTHSDFFHHFDVVCPQCQGKAEVKRLEPGFFSEVALRCEACGHQETREPRRLKYDNQRDAYFNLPLWRQTRCFGMPLAVFNQAHLEYLKAFVAAEVREGPEPDPELGAGYRMRTLISTLPDWLKAEENRDAILKALAKLEHLA